jgi:hypothetical protein
LALRGELGGGTEGDAPDPAVIQFINGMIWNGTFEGRFTDKQFAIDVFNRHNEDVKSKVPADRLLVRHQGRLGAALRLPGRRGSRRADAAP